ncbi:MAG: N utilization substance protein B [Alcanivorax borkumensis]|jgi:N utilization substance protein B|uniref:Transcription antitermination protein NusB n=1 Tax=Alcanivorax borkumensis (strain ATCC 700651 / DSM 11573 / NCIMB 13689 / SK2) TaxID=393595 RepID=NUSB_ALCBS|nr:MULTISPECIES: transcription antitermination factor NusB [Alcanivorax]Q0VMI0.1 RecName: Full=Transcription antitermination protein NusB; AltName: Full=Antitermination factor NusB [Alcanivorax borkumensis SK2]OJH07259.1 MAG: N utilization substance protein B [Alcanivorax borkumensis]EUC68599.1 transcription antitermination protein NusB [Alcanivorax sp. 97CO-5]PKG00998.1 N utilization substance protein B [Alcanivorax sp. 97CO-6]CAL17618.1 transcriptional terminator nusB [Alcanivorax borkumensi
MNNPSTPSARRKARRFTLQALYQWQLAGAAVSDIEAQFLANQDFAKVDREYFHDLLHGVLGQVKTLDEQLTPYLDRRVEELSQVEKAILRLGAFELKERQDVPYRVVINEGIELAKVFGAEDSFKYVNGVLDKLARQLRYAEASERRPRD